MANQTALLNKIIGGDMLSTSSANPIFPSAVRNLLRSSFLVVCLGWIPCACSTTPAAVNRLAKPSSKSTHSAAPSHNAAQSAGKNFQLSVDTKYVFFVEMPSVRPVTAEERMRWVRDYLDGFEYPGENLNVSAFDSLDVNDTRSAAARLLAECFKYGFDNDRDIMLLEAMVCCFVLQEWDTAKACVSHVRDILRAQPANAYKTNEDLDQFLLNCVSSGFASYLGLSREQQSEILKW